MHPSILSTININIYLSMNRFREGKKLLLASLTCWILFTIPLSFIKPEAVNCIERNQTDFVLTYTRAKRETTNLGEPESVVPNTLQDELTLLMPLQSIEMHSRYLLQLTGGLGSFKVISISF